MYAICCVPVAAVRAVPDHRSEMKSQLLFGESVAIKENDKKNLHTPSTQRVSSPVL